jgi:hypothetical protein
MNLPVLVNRETALGCFTAREVVGANSSLLNEERQSYVNLARLLDKSRDEYLTAVAYIKLDKGMDLSECELDRVWGNRSFYYHKIADHLENCVNALRRVWRLMVFSLKLKGKEDIYNSAKLKDIRDLIEHLDRDINRGLSGYSFIIVEDDCKSFSFGNYVMTFDELVMLIDDFYAIWEEYMN